MKIFDKYKEVENRIDTILFIIKSLHESDHKNIDENYGSFFDDIINDLEKVSFFLDKYHTFVSNNKYKNLHEYMKHYADIYINGK